MNPTHQRRSHFVPSVVGAVVAVTARLLLEPIQLETWMEWLCAIAAGATAGAIAASVIEARRRKRPPMQWSERDPSTESSREPR